MPRLSADVIQELLHEMDRIVVSYPDRVVRTGQTLDQLVAGTAFFPGGTGLWRGRVSGGALPICFPNKPVMFVAHNFGNLESLQEALKHKGEAHSSFANLWTNLLGFLAHAGPLEPAQCFFTNALMALRPDGRSGGMPKGPRYVEECISFLSQQVRIVDPGIVILLGGDAERIWSSGRKLHSNIRTLPFVDVMHPSARPLNQKPNRDTWLQTQGLKILHTIAGISNPQ